MSAKKDSYNEYMKGYMLRRYHKRRQAAVQQLGGTCSVCGTSEERLEFDHKDREKKSFTMAKFSSASEEKWQAELAKCQLLCRECHNKKSIEERGFKVAKGTHGTLSSCRYCGPPLCQQCRDVKNAYSRELKRKHRRLKKLSPCA